MSEGFNPYAPPQHDDQPSVTGPTGEASHLEAIRRAHINAETNVKGLGFLLYIGAVGFGLSGVGLLVTNPVRGVVDVCSGAALVLGGYWLRRLDPRGRLVYSVFVGFAVISMLVDLEAQPAMHTVGRLIWPLLFVAAIWSAKASTVMTPHYREVVVPATPHIKHKTSPVLLVLLGIVVLAFLAAIVVAAVR